MKPLYSTEAISTGDARNGRARLADGTLDFDLAMPREMGGKGGEGANPEQFFALGYAACFHSALKLVASEERVDVSDSSVSARVTIGNDDEGGFELKVALEVSVPHLLMVDARKLAQKAHSICPYSKATRGNIEVVVDVVEA